MTDPALIPLLSRAGQIRGYALVDPEDLPLISWRTWRLAAVGYAVVGSAAGIHMYMHRELMGLDPGDKRQVDHINRNKLDNRRENLRILAIGENSQNLHPRVKTSRFRGVSWHEHTRKWVAYGNKKGVKFYLGLHATEEDAYATAETWRRENLPHAIEEDVP